jgi:hypothetical protein
VWTGLGAAVLYLRKQRGKRQSHSFDQARHRHDAGIVNPSRFDLRDRHRIDWRRERVGLRALRQGLLRADAFFTEIAQHPTKPVYVHRHTSIRRQA